MGPIGGSKVAVIVPDMVRTWNGGSDLGWRIYSFGINAGGLFSSEM